MDHWFDAGNYSFHMLFHNFSHSNAACRALIPRQRNAWNMSEPPGARTRQSAESSKGIVRGPLGYISGPCFEWSANHSVGFVQRLLAFFVTMINCAFSTLDSWTFITALYICVYIYMCVLTCLAAAALVRVNSQHDSTKSSFYILVTWSVYVCSVFIIFALLWRTLVGAWLGPSSSLPLRIRSIVLRSLLALLVLAGRVEKEADGSVQSRLRWVSFEEKKAETQRHLNITECLYIVVNYKCCKFISLLRILL